MKKSINYWSFAEKLTDGSKMSLKDCMEQAKEAGFEAIELTVAEEGELSLNSTRRDVEKIVQAAEEVGIELSSLATGLFWDYSLSSSNDKVKDKAKGIVKKMLELASYLGIDTILVVPGAVDVFFKPEAEVVPYDVAYKRSLESLRECLLTAEKYKVNIGIENVWNKFLLSPLEMRDFIDKLGSDYLGAYFDVGNTLLTGYPEHWIRILGKRIKRVHIKDFKRVVGNVNGFCDLLEGDVNWAEVMKALREIGYNDYITAEILPPYSQHPEALIYNTSRSMDSILGR
ncbi:xylulose 5-phosphate 3-epimerase [Candidatus Aerophobetes bacterium Ae_b3a]|nr:MAG: xylulose 5-phosphate 3-epimerase [Candidatus Aerophobetes bacterium Ae_b3a]